MNSSMEYKYKLYKLLLTFNGLMIDNIRYNGTMLTRCPFCGDSKDHSHGHLYILGLNEDSPYDPNYYCQKCQTNGYIDMFFLELLELYDSDIEVLAKKHKIYKSKNTSKKGFKENDKIQSKLLPPLNNENTKRKLKLFEDRMGIKLTTEKILKYKMVFNLLDYLEYNNIRNITRDKQIVKALDEKYLGFLSVNNEFINMRNMGEITKYNKRYENYNVYGIQDNTKRFYVIENKINVMNTIDVHIAEGTADIIGVREHVCNCKDDDTIYAACLGLSYENIIRYIVKKGILFANYHIYSDQGVPISEYREIKKKLKDVVKGEFNIYYNTNKDYKDCGTRKENIKLKKHMV